MPNTSNAKQVVSNVVLLIVGGLSTAVLFWGALAGLLQGIPGVLIASVASAALAYSVAALTDPNDGVPRKLAVGFLIAGFIGASAGQFWAQPTGSQMAGLFILLGFVVATAVTIWATVTTKRQ